jgi:hypothetical protein
MAECKVTYKDVIVKVDKTEDEIILKLSKEEAATLHYILRNIRGCYYNNIRKYIDSICRALAHNKVPVIKNVARKLQA